MNKFFIRTLAIACLSTIAVSAHAGDAKPANEGGVQFALSGGITGGGDTIDTVTYTNGTSVNIHAGGLLQVGAGVVWQLDEVPLAMAATVNYHFDRANGSNGNVRFTRTPIELIGYYTGVQKWRFGGGARFSSTPKYTYDVNNVTASVEFKNTTGAVIEAGYQVAPNGWLNLRYVSEKFTASKVTSGSVSVPVPNAPSVSGSHVGLNFLYQF